LTGATLREGIETFRPRLLGSRLLFVEKNQNARESIETSPDLRAHPCSSHVEKTKMPVRALRRGSRLQHGRGHDVEKTKMPVRALRPAILYQVTQGRVRPRGKNQNAREGIETRRRIGFFSSTPVEKTKIPVRARSSGITAIYTIVPAAIAGCLTHLMRAPL
jgi:hypothetical protein